MTKLPMVQGSLKWKSGCVSLQATSIHGLPPTPHQEATSLSLPQMSTRAGFYAPTSPNAPYLQLSKGLEGKNFDGPREAKTWDMDQLKKNKQQNTTPVTEARHTSLS